MLTDKEKQVLRLIAEGLTKTQIAESMYISEGTVRKHCENIRNRLNARNLSQAVFIYYGTES